MIFAQYVLIYVDPLPGAIIFLDPLLYLEPERESWLILAHPLPGAKRPSVIPGARKRALVYVGPVCTFIDPLPGAIRPSVIPGARKRALVDVGPVCTFIDPLPGAKRPSVIPEARKRALVDVGQQDTYRPSTWSQKTLYYTWSLKEIVG